MARPMKNPEGIGGNIMSSNGFMVPRDQWVNHLRHWLLITHGDKPFQAVDQSTGEVRVMSTHGDLRHIIEAWMEGHDTGVSEGSRAAESLINGMTQEARDVLARISHTTGGSP